MPLHEHTEIIGYRSWSGYFISFKGFPGEGYEAVVVILVDNAAAFVPSQ
jgi:hypothetical protein